MLSIHVCLASQKHKHFSWFTLYQNAEKCVIIFLSINTIKRIHYMNHTNTPGRQQSKTPILSRNVDQKSIETVFSIAICRHTGDKWESKTLFLSIFDPRSSIVDNVFDFRLSGETKTYPFPLSIMIFTRLLPNWSFI